MSSNLLIAIIVASVIAVACIIAFIIFLALKCSSKHQKHEKQILGQTFSNRPTILKRYPPTQKQILLNKEAQMHYNRRPLVYTVVMPEPVNPNQATINNKTSRGKKKIQPEKVWPTQNTVPASDRPFVWRAIVNKSDPEPHKDSPNNKEEDANSSFSDRQRKPHVGSIRHLPGSID